MLAAGTAIGEFRIERVLGEGPRGVVYAARQASLDRHVALKLYRAGTIPPQRRRAVAWIDHPHVASLYAAGDSEHGFFTATRLVDGATLEELAAGGRLDPARAAQLCDQVAAALAAAHAAGVVHGAVSPSNVLVTGDGEALLTDFAAGDDAAGPAGDLAALERIRQRLTAPHGRSRRRGRRAAGAALLVLVAGGGAVLATRPEGGDAPAPPAAGTGVVALGSDLAGTATRSVDCQGQAPSGSSLACTIVQTRLPGRRVVVPEHGAIRRWIVRGARGELALHAVRRRDRGWFVAGSSQLQRVPDDGLHVLAANFAVRRGDRLGVELAPGTAIGVREGTAGAATERFIGPLRDSSQMPSRARLAHELLVRVDYAPGAAPRHPRVLTGAAAARAPAGRALATGAVEVAGGGRTLVVVAAGREIAVDLFAGSRRLSRVTIPDADPRGRLFRLEVFDTPTPLVIWRNPGGQLVAHSYTLARDALRARD